MIGIFIITHETFGIACEELSCHFFGEGTQHVRHLSVHTVDDIDALKIKAKKMRDEIDFGHGVLVLNDIFGASPYNIARTLITDEKTALLTGANAAMIVRAINFGRQTENLNELLLSAQNAAHESIINITIDNVEQYD
ncbi:PTS sugar transporter subunit IIA [Neisseria sp. Ec49-e6-T10]|uniref:PTS sugar transporter subunit IIA n=1 Tax=Neisseria sp. Ec49-e6-T10 TaxID=3140744 RepID=UPI003EBA5217